MTNLTVAAPNGPVNGPLSAALPTGPRFNVFVLLPRNQLQISRAGGLVQVYWPVGAGSNALQTSSSLVSADSWTDTTTTPVVVGDQFMIAELASSAQKFYRLRPQ